MSEPRTDHPERTPGRFRIFLHALWRLIASNWGYKLLSVLLALALWAGLITQDPTLTREKTMADGSVTVLGSDTLLRAGYIVTDGLDDIPSVTIRAEIPQGQYQAAQASNYNPRIDLSRISATGEQELKIATTNSTSYGTVHEVTPASVTVTVDEYITRYRIPVRVEALGEAPAGWYSTAPSAEPSILAVSGPRSLVERIVRAEAALDLATLPAQEGTVRTAVSFRLVDRQGEEIPADSLQITSQSVLIDSVVLEQSMLPMKTLNLSTVGLVTGTPAEGYEIKSITITPSSVNAAGPDEVLAQLDAIYADATVDVTDLTDSINRSIRVRKPTELNYLSQDTVTVAVEIGPILSSRTFRSLRVEPVGLGEGLTASLEPRTAEAEVEGDLLWVLKLRASDLRLRVDLTGLTAGEYDLPVICELADENSGVTAWSAAVTPETVHVTVQEK